MTTKVKRKMICVEPITKQAKLRFDELMNSIHSCYVDDENDASYFLTAVNGKYKLQISKKDDCHWKIVK